MALLTTVFTSRAAMERKIGADAVRSFADHDGDFVADDSVIDDAVNQATEEILLLAGQRYSAASLAESELIKRWATAMACYYLCSNRGNPPPEVLSNEIQRIYGILERLAEGEWTLTGVNLHSDLRPSMSNRTIDRRYKYNSVRVTRTNSTDAPTSLKQDRANDIVRD